MNKNKLTRAEEVHKNQQKFKKTKKIKLNFIKSNKLWEDRNKTETKLKQMKLINNMKNAHLRILGK